MPDRFSGAVWRKASFSTGGGECVEVARLDDETMAVRHSKRPEDGTLVFTREEFAAWLNGCKAGEFDDLVAALG
jgi:hypothetical protein